MCTSTPDIPVVPERQPAKLPDSGADANASDPRSRRRAILAGLIGPAMGLGAPSVSKPTLG